MYGADRYSNENTPKYLQSLVYCRAPGNHPESNQYAYPLPFSARLNLYTGEVVSIDWLATGGTEDGLAYRTAPETPMAHLSPNEYFPDLLDETPRQDLMPLQIVQPEGPSFQVIDENCINWQKWRFRVGFNYREGATIHDVRYDERAVFYRLSVSEMTVPYGGRLVFTSLRRQQDADVLQILGVLIIESRHLTVSIPLCLISTKATLQRP